MLLFIDNKVVHQNVSLISIPCKRKFAFKGKFIQTVQYGGHRYGLSRDAIEDVAREGLACCVHMELEVCIIVLSLIIFWIALLNSEHSFVFLYQYQITLEQKRIKAFFCHYLKY